MHFFKSEKNNILTLYNKIVLLTRENFFYKDFKLSDSFSNRIYLIFFHLSFILIVLRNKESDKNDQQAIFDFFFKQIELNCRELGYGDMTVNKKMKVLIKLFYEILIQCNDWKQLQIDNKNNLLLSFFSNNYNNRILINKLTNYFDKFAFFIEDISLNSMRKGIFNFVYKEQINMAVPKRKTSKSRKKKRRSHIKFVSKNIIEDKKSGEYRLSHHVDLKTGFYKGRQVFEPKD